ncbi:MAG: hypothetical protein O7G86_14520 [Gammaproteobacteria bacterium]|nr:hypothetical protein [Gammaproteobacteria bacterium]
MFAISQEEFYVPAYKAGVTFRRNGNRQVTHFDYRGIKAKRMEAGAWNPSIEELRALEGEYFSEELATSYSVELRGEALIAKYRRHQAIVGIDVRGDIPVDVPAKLPHALLPCVLPLN